MKKKLLVVIFLFLLNIICINVDAKELNVVYPESNNNVLFEGIGKYAFATAGNNLVYRGSSFEMSGQAPSGNGRVGIFPTNKDEVLSWLPSDLASKINNLSGSKLEYSGDVIKGTLNMMKLCSSGSITCPVSYDILIIYPDHSYNIYKGADNTHSIYDIEIKDAGWYYVSILSDQFILFNQDAWAINVIYEDQTLPIRYLKLLNPNYDLYTGQNVEIKFDSKLNLTDNFQLYGLIVGAGNNAWHDVESGLTYDTLEAILDDGTYKKLYETEYNGKTIFKDRKEYDFARSVFSTIRNPEGEDTWGGELDVFNETLSSDFFGGKSIIGYRFYKDFDWYRINLVGLAQAIEIPEYEIKANVSKTEDKNVIQNRIVIKNTSEYSSCNTTLTIPYDDYIKEIKKENIVVTPSISRDNIEIDNTNKTITIHFPEVIESKTEYTVRYLTTLDSMDREVTLDPTLSYYPANGNTCLIDITSNTNFRYEVSAHDNNQALIVKVNELKDVDVKTINIEDTGLTTIKNIIIGFAFILSGFTIVTTQIRRLKLVKIKENE